MRRTWLIILILIFSSFMNGASGSTPPKPGNKCSELGMTKTVNALTFKCKKSTRKQFEQFQYRYVWSKGKLSSKITASSSFDGRKYGDGAVAGSDIKPGRYWSMNCVGWQHYSDAELISKALRGGSQQSMVELKPGETLLSGCQWYLGEPPAADVLPTGKLSMKTQLVPGRYRPINEFCMTGPADPRSPDAISEEKTPKNILVWEQLPKSFELVITGNENWLAYGLTSECGGLKRLD